MKPVLILCQSNVGRFLQRLALGVGLGLVTFTGMLAWCILFYPVIIFHLVGTLTASLACKYCPMVKTSCLTRSVLCSDNYNRRIGLSVA